MDEYLEKLFAEAFKREVDQDEAVWRTLPFFATAFGLGSTVIGYAALHLPAWDVSAYPIICYVLFAAALLTIVVAFSFLWNAVRQRAYRYPPPDVELLAHARDLHAFHLESGATAEEADREVVREMRALMIEQFARAASNNRVNNGAKQRARTAALAYLMLGFAFAFVMISLTFVLDRLRPASAGETQQAQHASIEPDRTAVHVGQRPSPVPAARAAKAADRLGGVPFPVDAQAPRHH